MNNILPSLSRSSEFLLSMRLPELNSVYISGHQSTLNFVAPLKLSVDHSGCEVWVINCLRPLEYWDRGFESYSMHRYLCAFILCLCCSVCK
jgi:hypothetical protein